MLVRRKRLKRTPIKQKSTASRLTKYLDAMLRALVLERDGYRCLRCGKITNLQASHIYSKGKHQAMRYRLENVVAMCNGCHIFWWHKEPIAAFEWALGKLGAERMKKLALMAQTPGKVNRQNDRLYLEAEIAKRGLLPLPSYSVGKRGARKP